MELNSPGIKKLLYPHSFAPFIPFMKTKSLDYRLSLFVALCFIALHSCVFSKWKASPSTREKIMSRFTEIRGPNPQYLRSVPVLWRRGCGLARVGKDSFFGVLYQTWSAFLLHALQGCGVLVVQKV